MNKEKALKLFLQSVNMGNVWPLGNLAFMYFNGEGTTRDVKKGIAYLKKAAEKNDEFSQFNLGLIYYNGSFGVKKNYSKAISLMKRAAESGYPKAQYALGIFYHDGKAVRKNIKEAYFWTYIAFEVGYEKAIGNLNVLADQLTTAERIEEIDKAKSWLKSHPKKNYAAEMSIPVSGTAK